MSQTIASYITPRLAVVGFRIHFRFPESRVRKKVRGTAWKNRDRRHTIHTKSGFDNDRSGGGTEHKGYPLPVAPNKSIGSRIYLMMM